MNEMSLNTRHLDLLLNATINSCVGVDIDDGDGA
jgi:hypothetical protein